MHEVDVTPAALCHQSVVLGRLAFDLVASCLGGSPASCGDELAAAAVGAALEAVTAATGALSGELQVAAGLVAEAARVYDRVEAALADE